MLLFVGDVVDSVIVGFVIFTVVIVFIADIAYPNITGITKQYSYDNKTWTKYTTALTIDTNKTIYARSIDSTNQGSDSTRVASLSVTNIDKTPPTVTHTIKNKKAKSVDIVITATDKNGIKSIANVNNRNNQNRHKYLYSNKKPRL